MDKDMFTIVFHEAKEKVSHAPCTYFMLYFNAWIRIASVRSLAPLLPKDSQLLHIHNLETSPSRKIFVKSNNSLNNKAKRASFDLGSPAELSLFSFLQPYLNFLI